MVESCWVSMVTTNKRTDEVPSRQRIVTTRDFGLSFFVLSPRLMNLDLLLDEVASPPLHGVTPHAKKPRLSEYLSMPNGEF